MAGHCIDPACVLWREAADSRMRIINDLRRQLEPSIMEEKARRERIAMNIDIPIDFVVSLLRGMGINSPTVIQIRQGRVELTVREAVALIAELDRKEGK